MKKLLLLSLSHLVAAAAGVALGVYLLPILIAPSAPSTAEIASASQGALYVGEFRRDLKDSDALHWGEGPVHVGRERIVIAGRLAPGPDYRLYLSPEFIETEADFNRLKPNLVRVGDVRSFSGAVVPVGSGVDVARYTTVIVWCETFSQFITAARYR